MTMTETPAPLQKRRDRRLGQSGAVMVEFALLLPPLLLILTGIIGFGVVLNQYVLLWNGTGMAAFQFAISGGGASGTPATKAWTALTQNAPTLTTGGTCGATGTSLCMTLSVAGTACVSNLSSAPTATEDSACNTALTNAVGQPAVVTATYPCAFMNVVYYNPFPSCLLAAQITELVE
jgi:Flp pilus assembly protein TadG